MARKHGKVAIARTSPDFPIALNTLFFFPRRPGLVRNGRRSPDPLGRQSKIRQGGLKPPDTGPQQAIRRRRVGLRRPDRMVRFMCINIAELFAAELANVDSTAQLDELLTVFSRKLGFDHFALSLEMRSEFTPVEELLLHDYPEEWAKVYCGFELAGQDPVRRACDKTFTGFSWQTIADIIPLTRADRQMLHVGRDCGIGDGFTVPRHLPGLARGTCTFAVAPDRPLPNNLLTTAEAIGALALRTALEMARLPSTRASPELTDRQRECLLWVARGKTAAETAIILGIGTETVIQHLKVARERYDVHCKQSLIVAALFDGLIGFSDLIRWSGRRDGRRLAGKG